MNYYYSDGSKYPKRVATTIAIWVSASLAVLTLILGVLLHPPRGSPTNRLIGGAFGLFFGLLLFLYLVVETWQTRRVIMAKGGPLANYETSPGWYIFCLVLFGLFAAAIFFVSVREILRYIW